MAYSDSWRIKLHIFGLQYKRDYRERYETFRYFAVLCF